MGRILGIRLSETTTNEDDVFRTWPNLCFLAWPGQGEIRGGVWSPVQLPPRLAPPVAREKSFRTVLDLIRDLLEEFEFGDWSAEKKNDLKSEMASLAKAFASLEKALGDWQIQSANTATDTIEDALDALEKTVARAA